LEKKEEMNEQIYSFYAKHRDPNEKCVWRIVRESDLEKIARDDKHITFSDGNKCCRCDGFKYACPEYVSEKLRGYK